MKLLLFGGTFDPPHNGHVALLRHAIEAVQPDKIIVMPAGTPPHKAASQTPGEWRYEMCRCFLSVDPRVQLSRFELQRQGKSYTLLTVEHLAEKYPGAKIYLAIGSDMLLTFTEWHDYRTLLSKVILVAQSRDAEETAQMLPAIEALRKENAEILFMDVQVLKLSSTALRQAAEEGEDISAFIPPEVTQVLHRHPIYRKGIPAMIDADYCRSLAQKTLSERRYTHTCNVAQLAAALAKQYGADPQKAEIAGYLHDICKEMPKAQMLQMLHENAIITDNADQKPVGVWHAAAAMIYSKDTLHIEDEEILNAIRYHTSARAGMTKLDKIIYMADMCSAERDYKEVGELRVLLQQNLDTAITRALELSLQWLTEEKRDIDTDSIAALDWMKQQAEGTH